MLSMAKKLEIWEHELPKDKVALIAYAVNEGIKDEVDKRVDKDMAAIKYGLTSSISSALFELFDCNSEQINEVITKSNEHLKEKEKFLEKWGANFMDRIKELEPKIKEEIKNLTKGIDPEKVNRLEVVKKVQKKFNIPLDNANEIFRIVKEEDYNANCPEQYKPNTVKNKAKSEEKVVSKVNTPKEQNKSSDKPIEVKKEEIKDMFELIEEKRVLKGKTGIYEKYIDGVKDGEMFFKDINRVEEYEAKEILGAQKQLEEQINMLRAEHGKNIDRFINHMKEVKAVFSYRG